MVVVVVVVIVHLMLPKHNGWTMGNGTCTAALKIIIIIIINRFV